MAQPTHFLAGKKIIVAGAGMAGLSFTTALRKRLDPALPFPLIKIYERDTRETAIGREGFSLSLAGYDETGGLYALKQLGLLDEILPHVILGLEGPGGFKMWDEKFGQVMSVKLKPAEGLPSSGIRVARRDLRRVLIEAGESDVIWNSSCMSARKLDSGRMLVTVENRDTGETLDEECDLLICADGSNSRLRAALRPDDKLAYLGAIQMGGQAHFEERLPDPVGENWGMAVTGQGVGCFFSPVDKKSVVWALSRVEDERRPVTSKSPEEDRRAVLSEALQLGKMLSEPFPSIVRATEIETAFAMPAKDKQPFEHDLSQGPVVFIGDANHAVSPFAGYGASLALKDGWDLADQLVQASNLGEGLRAYDKISVPRAKKVLDTAHSRVSQFHSTGIRFFFFKLFSVIGGYMLWLTGQS